MPQPRRLALSLILVAAFALRVVHNTHLLPPVFDYPNEKSKRDTTLSLVENKFDHGRAMPSFLYNSLFLLYHPARAVHSWGQRYFPDVRPFSFDLMVFYLWVGRVYMALFGVGSVWAVYLLGRRLGSARLGLTAAALLAVAPIHVLGSRHMKEDMPLGFFATVAIVCLVDLVRKGRRRDYIRSGLLCGACFSTRWLGVVAIAPLLVAHFLSKRRCPDAPRPRRPIALAVGCMIAGFFLLSPDYLLAPGKVYKGLKRGFRKSASSHSDGMAVSAFDNAYTDYFRTGLWPGMTPPLLFLALLGWAWLRRNGRKEETALVAFWIVFLYILLESARARPFPHYQRYLQPLIPCVAVLAAAGIPALLGSAAFRRSGATDSNRRAWILLTGLAMAWPLHDTVRYLWHIPRSTIIQAYNEIPDLIPEGSLVISDRYGPGLDEARWRKLGYRDGERLAFDVFPAEPGYVLYSSMGLGRFLAQPDANPTITRFVHFVLGRGELVAEWRPAFRSFYCESPLIRLYHFPTTEAPFRTNAPASADDG